MTPLFDPSFLVHDAGWFAVWRQSNVGGIRVTGELTDDKNPVWRAFIDADCAARGWPRFMVLDVRGAIPAASLPKRIESALWGRKVLSQIEWGVIGVGKSAAGIAVRTILRVVGLSNVTLIDDDARFNAAVVRLLAGERPPAP